ncbi:MAG: peptide-methionine (R)-S-oxide reductase MsrB [Burkholderiales bacterium]|nr:peptide-methionine (R)-S-oxide reductase MsrB [Burkholderiales bacterium]
MNRRTFLGFVGIGAASAATTLLRANAAQPGAGMDSIAQLQKDWKNLLAPGAVVELSRQPLQRGNAEWKKILTPQQYDVLRDEGTERPGSSPLNQEKRPGVFVCAGCSAPLFTSAMKYDSGTGWPSFFTAIPQAFGTRRDFKLILPRTEYHCARCGGHHGHLFDDGPPPTGLRYCNNGVALRFIPKG